MFSLTCLSIAPTYIYAQNPQYSSLIPTNWRVLYSAMGDLNGDKANDVALIIEQQNPKNFIKDIEQRTFNINPRHLLVFINRNNQYQQVERNTTLPTQDNPESSCQMDPLAESEGISIKRGVLKIHFSYFMSCGGWEWPTHTYTFRMENNMMKLIGFDYRSFHRATGEETESSYNFSTLKVKKTSGGNRFEGGRPRSTWSVFKPQQQFYLSKIKFDDFYHQFEY